MAKPKKILCVCVGNSDRSPVMAAVLSQFLKNAGHEAEVESAGVGENAAKGGCAGHHGVEAAKRLGLDITKHNKRRTNSLNLKEYDLIICATDGIAGQLYEQGADVSKLYNAEISNPWPCQFQEQYDVTMEQILVMSYRIIKFYFS